ncbi:MAG: uracil-DNA glycosylase [Bacteroidota bacterium]
MPLDQTLDQLLRWYMDAGVDEAIGEVALDRFALSAKPTKVVDAAKPAAPRPAPPAPAPMSHPQGAAFAHGGHAIPGTAAHIAAECKTLEQLRQALEAFDGLALKRTARSTVFADGNADANVMVIGEAPGAEEDRNGLPFVGKSGKLLDRMLASIGLDRDTVYITNVVPWRPVENRKPTAEEVAVCLPFVTRHIELVDPHLLILLGGASASALLARHEGINRLRGRWFDYASPGLPRPLPALATFHPAYLLRTPAAKREAWRDLLQVKKRLDAGH